MELTSVLADEIRGRPMKRRSLVVETASVLLAEAGMRVSKDPLDPGNSAWKTASVFSFCSISTHHLTL
jgi:hypothetical protein